MTLALGLEPLATTRRADGVFEQLRERILSGAYPAGGRLPNERELALALGVNRSSVREAIKRLEFLELVEVRHGHGTFACDPGSSSALQMIEALLRDLSTVTVPLLEQLLAFRRDITLRVVELVATQRSDVHLVRARALLEREAAEGWKPEAALRIDLELNALLGEATSNLMYQLICNLFSKLVTRLGPLYYNQERDHSRSLRTHRELLVAIETRDAARARQIAVTMLGYSERTILEEARGLAERGSIGPGVQGKL